VFDAEQGVFMPGRGVFGREHSGFIAGHGVFGRISAGAAALMSHNLHQPVANGSVDPVANAAQLH